MLLSISIIGYAQDTIKIMTYNVLDYPNSNGSSRNAAFQTILSYNTPDILVVQELNELAGMFDFLNNVLTPVNPKYKAAWFINGPTTDNGLYYDSTKFSFISNVPLYTSLRDINEFTMVHLLTGDTLLLYDVHLKASSGSANENQREGQVQVLRNRTNSLTPGTHFMVLGDFNIYGSFEAAYQDLLNTSGSGYFVDLYNLQGTWNNNSFSNYHTQSTRLSTVGSAGAGGGLDDRFDMILFSQSIIDTGGINVIPSSYDEFGNDGNHYNVSINTGSNLNVPSNVAQALYDASDHLPVITKLTFGTSLGLSANPIDATCFGVSDGSIVLNVFGGIPPFSYSWSNGSTKQNLNNITSGQYSITITDASGSSMSQTINVGADFELHLVTIKQNVTCNGLMDASARVVPFGGAAPYYYLWNTNPSQTNDAIFGLGSGTYTAIVTDYVGCEAQREVNILEPSVLQVFYIPTPPTSGQSNGSVDLLVTGGIAPYTYLWSTGETTEDVSGKPAGVYFVTTVDRNGCAELVVVNL